MSNINMTGAKKDCHCQDPPPNLLASLPEVMPAPEVMAAELDQALEAEFLASGSSSSASGDHFAALVQILQQYPGIKITLSA